MKKWILIAIAAVPIAFMISGAPVAVHLESDDYQRTATCYNLAWYGIQRTDFDLSKTKGPMTSAVCWK
jgi:hypothetical protein